jgi:hypothetical protein
MVLASEAPSSNKNIAQVEIERLGFGYSEVAQYPIENLSIDRRVQVREVKHYAPKETVEQYAVQMSNVPFPPIVVTKDAWIIDGNTRIGAHVKRKDAFTPAIVVEVSWNGATEKQRNLLHALAATPNATGGVRLTSKETREVATRLIKLGWKSDQIGRAIGLKASGVSGVKQELDAVAKLSKVGIVDTNGAAQSASLRALGNSGVVSLNDVPFKELAELAMDAGFNVGEIRSTAKAAKDAGSDQGALDVIRKLRREAADRITEHKLTGKGKPPMPRQLRQHLGFVNKFEGREQELVETNPDNAENHLAALKAAVKVLTEVLKAQEA